MKEIFCLYDNKLRNIHQLDTWIGPALQLTRRCRYLYSSPLEEIYNQKENEVIQWFAKKTGRQTITRNNDSQYTISSVSADQLTVKITSRDQLFYTNTKEIKEIRRQSIMITTKLILTIIILMKDCIPHQIAISRFNHIIYKNRYIINFKNKDLQNSKVDKIQSMTYPSS